MYCQGCCDIGRQPDNANWRVVKYVLVAGSDAEAHARVFSAQSSYRYAFGYLLEVLTRAGRIAGLKSRPDMADRDVTVDSIIEGRVIYGSAQTVVEKLVAFRREVGPFGHLMMTGMDWAGPNAAWERESMHRLVEEVMPVLRRRVQSQAAE
jgi:alkanesulfonate monooxygenase SsuD/methylene tetrahydromethanopterin reductase-like flavin-dependent oxidoreductase (luciferase family)